MTTTTFASDEAFLRGVAATAFWIIVVLIVIGAFAGYWLGTRGRHRR